MKKRIAVVIILIIVLNTLIVTATSQYHATNKLNQGRFRAEIGVFDSREPIYQLTGRYSEMRGKKILTGTINPLEFNRTSQFRGYISRNTFILQSPISDRILSIIGVFQEFNEEDNTYTGHWRGIILGYGYTNGWIVFTLS